MSEKSNKKWYNALGQLIVENSGSGAVMFPSQIDEKMKIQAAINQQKIFVPTELQKNNETLQKLEKQLEETPKWKDQDQTKPITPNIPLNVKKDSSSTMLRYPDQLQHQESDYMMFSFYDYVPVSYTHLRAHET